MRSEMKKWEFTDELSSIAPEEIEENSSIFGNFCFGITAEQLEELKAGRVLFSREEYGIFLAIVDEHPAEVKRRKEAQQAAELEALKKRVRPGDYVWLKMGYTVRKLKVTGVTDESIYAGHMKFSIRALDDALFTEEPGKEDKPDGA